MTRSGGAILYRLRTASAVIQELTRFISLITLALHGVRPKNSYTPCGDAELICRLGTTWAVISGNPIDGAGPLKALSTPWVRVLAHD